MIRACTMARSDQIDSLGVGGCQYLCQPVDGMNVTFHGNMVGAT